MAAVFGAGAQRDQAWAAATVRKLDEIRVYDPFKVAVDGFRRRMEATAVPIVKAANGEEA